MEDRTSTFNVELWREPKWSNQSLQTVHETQPKRLSWSSGISEEQLPSASRNSNSSKHY